MDLRLYILALEAGIPKTGLTLADFQVNIWSVRKLDRIATQLTTNAAMGFEVGGGHYGYFLDDADYFSFNYFAKVEYIGAEALDTTQWVDTKFFDKGINQLFFAVFCPALGVGKTGLTLSDFKVNVWGVDSDETVTHTVIDQPISVEVGGGFYAYYDDDIYFWRYDYMIQIEYAGAVVLDMKLWSGSLTGFIDSVYSDMLTRLRIDLKDMNYHSYRWSELEIARHLEHALNEVARVRPYERKTEVLLTTGSRDVDITSMIPELYKIKKVEYPIDQYPKEFKNHSLFGETLSIEAGTAPVAGDTAKIWWEGSYTYIYPLPDYLIDLVIEGAAGYALEAYVIGGQQQISNVIEKFADVEIALGQITARMSQAIEDLASGRAKIGSKLTEAGAAIDNMANRIQEAIDKLTVGQDFINTISIGRDPTGDYARYATVELNNAASYLGQARGYLNEDIVTGEYSGSAGRELEVAMGYLREGQGNINLINSQISVARIMAAYVNLSQAKLAQFRTRLQSFRKGKAHHDYPA